MRDRKNCDTIALKVLKRCAKLADQKQDLFAMLKSQTTAKECYDGSKIEGVTFCDTMKQFSDKKHGDTIYNQKLLDDKRHIFKSRANSQQVQNVLNEMSGMGLVNHSPAYNVSLSNQQTQLTVQVDRDVIFGGKGLFDKIGKYIQEQPFEDDEDQANPRAEYLLVYKKTDDQVIFTLSPSLEDGYKNLKMIYGILNAVKKEFMNEQNNGIGTTMPQRLAYDQFVSDVRSQLTIFATKYLMILTQRVDTENQIESLLKDGYIDMEYKNPQGNTPLMHACTNGNLEIVKLLLENGANVNAKNPQGNTPLMTACTNGNLEIVKLLLPKITITADIIKLLTTLMEDGQDKLIQDFIKKAKLNLNLYTNPNQPKTKSIKSTTDIKSTASTELKTAINTLETATQFDKLSPIQKTALQKAYDKHRGTPYQDKPVHFKEFGDKYEEVKTLTRVMQADKGKIFEKLINSVNNTEEAKKAEPTKYLGIGIGVDIYENGKVCFSGLSARREIGQDLKGQEITQFMINGDDVDISTSEKLIAVRSEIKITDMLSFKIGDKEFKNIKPMVITQQPDKTLSDKGELVTQEELTALRQESAAQLTTK